MARDETLSAPQFMALVLETMEPMLGQIFESMGSPVSAKTSFVAKKPIWQRLASKLARAVGWDDRYFPATLRQVKRRKTTAPDVSTAQSCDAGPDISSALGWLLESDRRPEKARQRWLDLASTDAQMELGAAWEARLAFHVAAASAPDPKAKHELQQDLFELLKSRPPTSPSLHFLRECAIHLATDFGVDIHESLSDQEVRQRYEPSDHIFNLANNLHHAYQGRPGERGGVGKAIEDGLAALDRANPPALAVAAYMLTVRLAATPDSRDAAREYLEMLLHKYPQLHRAPTKAVAAYSAPLDYGRELARLLDLHEAPEVDLLALFTNAMVYVSDGRWRRRRRGVSEEEMSLGSGVSRTFCGWGAGHIFCQTIADTALYDARKEPDAATVRLRKLIEDVIKSPDRSRAVGHLFMEIFVPHAD